MTTTETIAPPRPVVPPASSGKELSGRHLVPIFAGLLVAMFLAALDQTIFSTALPTIVGDLHGVDQMLWVTTAYLLASTIMMPIYGKLGDLIGRKPLLLWALSIFVAGSLVGAVSQDMTMLIIGRAIQGIGGGGLMLLAQAIIADVVPARQRGRYMGVMGAVFGLSSVVGPLLGGWFTESLSWRVGFWLNVPLGAVAILSAVFFLKLPKHDQQRPAIDVWGILTMAVAVTSLILATSWGGNTYDWGSWQIIGLFGLTAVFGALFVLAEHRAKEPIIPLHLFKQRNFNLTTIAGLVIAIAMFGAIGYMPTYLQMSTGVSATVSGLMLIPMVAGLLVTSIISGQIVSRTGRYKWAPIASMIITAGGVLLLSTLTTDTATWVLMGFLFVLGAGIGTGMQNLILIVQNTFPAREVGTATAANNFFRQIGASLGSAVVGSIFTSRLVTLLGERLPAATPGAGGTDSNSLTPELVKQLPQQIQDIIVGAYNDALTPIFLYIAPLLVIGLVLVIFVKEKALATTIDGSGSDPAATPAAQMVTSATVEGGDDVEDADDLVVTRSTVTARSANGSTASNAPVLVESVDDPGEWSTVAALDVLTAARQQIRDGEQERDAARVAAVARLDDIGHQVDAVIGGFHRQLQDIRHTLQVEPNGTSAAGDHAAGVDQDDELRRYEHALLLDSQQTADRVARHAQQDADRTLADAEAKRAEIEARIEQLRRAEQELSTSVAGHLTPTAAATEKTVVDPA